MKNHYVSQLILKRFANALYIFDDNAKSISKHTQTENIFYKKDIYTDEVETAMNFNLENDFASDLPIFNPNFCIYIINSIIQIIKKQIRPTTELVPQSVFSLYIIWL